MEHALRLVHHRDISPDIAVAKPENPAVLTASQALPVDCKSDAQMISIWLHGKSPETARAYVRAVRDFFSSTGKSIRSTKLNDLLDYVDGLEVSDHRRYQVAMTLKSLFSHSCVIGYTPYNLGTMLKPPAPKSKMVERIIERDDVLQMIASEGSDRNRAILEVLYKGGLRVSEACGLKWRDAVAVGRGEGRLNVMGKGRKTRLVGLPAGAWAAVEAIRPENADPDAPVFRSRKGGHLDQSMINRIVKSAATRVGLTSKVSPHWLRHACGTDMVEAGVPLPEIQSHLGHKDLKTTQQYLHVRAGAVAARALEN